MISFRQVSEQRASPVERGMELARLHVPGGTIDASQDPELLALHLSVVDGLAKRFNPRRGSAVLQRWLQIQGVRRHAADRLEVARGEQATLPDQQQAVGGRHASGQMAASWLTWVVFGVGFVLDVFLFHLMLEPLAVSDNAKHLIAAGSGLMISWLAHLTYHSIIGGWGEQTRSRFDRSISRAGAVVLPLLVVCLVLAFQHTRSFNEQLGIAESRRVAQATSSQQLTSVVGADGRRRTATRAIAAKSPPPPAPPGRVTFAPWLQIGIFVMILVFSHLREQHLPARRGQVARRNAANSIRRSTEAGRQLELQEMAAGRQMRDEQAELMRLSDQAVRALRRINLDADAGARRAGAARLIGPELPSAEALRAGLYALVTTRFTDELPTAADIFPPQTPGAGTTESVTVEVPPADPSPVADVDPGTAPTSEDPVPVERGARGRFERVQLESPATFNLTEPPRAVPLETPAGASEMREVTDAVVLGSDEVEQFVGGHGI